MIAPIPLTPKWIILYSLISILCISVFLLRDNQTGFPSLETIQEMYNQNSFFDSNSNSNACISTCLVDPFMRKGVLDYPSHDQYNETRWIPLPPISSDINQHIKLANIDYSGDLPIEVENMVAEQITAKLNIQFPEQESSDAQRDPDSDFKSDLNSSSNLDWMKGRMVVFLDDRNNVEQLCGEVHGTLSNWGGHTGGLCYIERIDLTIVWWFLFGMVDDESLDEWRALESRPITFENKIEQVLLPLMKEAGLERKPDLVVISSLFWDEGFIKDYPVLYPPTIPLPDHYRDKPGFFLTQIQWHQSRLAQLFTFVRKTYDDDNLPMMSRTRHIRSNMQWGGGLKIAQLDNGIREISERMGVREFRWGDLLEGVSEYYDNDQHFPLGPNTYLFGDMTFFYLRKAITPGCWACHGIAG
ncbi:uncharacterized protein IL334_007496 [Kwoniella shivajii]|uniref:Uncharacterized protein n=1 Tax=Kwoniella shivajii TaxID=564305 RepID=A0ABZ1D9M5_9TREE|nr:hypothetical protein IL334_007496 [Kwoniella shivajii]